MRKFMGVSAVAAAALAMAAPAHASSHHRDVMRFAPAKMTIVGSDLKPHKPAKTHHSAPKTTTVHKTTSQPTKPPAAPTGPHTARYHAGDNQSLCMHGQDVGPWLRAHGDNVMRFIVDANTFTSQPGGPACVQRAEAEGYPVMLSLALEASWSPARDAQQVRQVIAAYGPVWAVSIGNEQELGSAHGGSMDSQQYAAVWAVAEPALARADPSALRVFGETSSYAASWVQRAWNDGHQGAQVISSHCYPQWLGGEQTEPEQAAWAASQGVPYWCSEMDAVDAGQCAFVARMVAASPNLQMVGSYYWPQIGANSRRAR